jgi:hypothetical protein
MYYEVGIQKLSENQLSKLRNGHPVRVKLGNHHKICLSIQQLKKLNKASQKGSALTISFDPYQLEAHGSGILGDIGRKAKAFIQKYKLQDIVNPVINRVKRESHKGVSKLSNYAHSKINELQPVEAIGGGPFTKAVSKLSKNKINELQPVEASGGGPISDVLGTIGNVGGPIGTVANVGSQFAKMFGFGVARKHSIPKKTKSKTRKGKGILTDLAKSAVKSVANKGIEVGANYLKDKVSGMGNKRFADARRIRGRRAPPTKRTFGGSGVDGGALYPGGYGGALYPGGY